VTEWIVLADHEFVIEKYAYYLIINGLEVRAWDKDARHPEQPVHGHIGADHARIPADEVTLGDVLGGWCFSCGRSGSVRLSSHA
jgi:hypothetical protein